MVWDYRGQPAHPQKPADESHPLWRPTQRGDYVPHVPPNGFRPSPTFDEEYANSYQIAAPCQKTESTLSFGVEMEFAAACRRCLFSQDWQAPCHPAERNKPSSDPSRQPGPPTDSERNTRLTCEAETVQRLVWEFLGKAGIPMGDGEWEEADDERPNDPSHWTVMYDPSVLKGQMARMRELLLYDHPKLKGKYPDGSPELNDTYFHNVEVVTAALYDTPKSYEQLALGVSVLTAGNDLLATRNSGLHVHVGSGDKAGFSTQTVRQVCAFWYVFEPYFRTLLNKGRFESINRWAGTLCDRAKIANKVHANGYNGRAMLNEKTDERYHIRSGPDATNMDLVEWAMRMPSMKELVRMFTAVDDTEIDEERLGLNVTNLKFEVPTLRTEGNWRDFAATRHPKGTIEFRVQGGCLDELEIVNWTKVCVGVVDWCEKTGKKDFVKFMRRYADRKKDDLCPRPWKRIMPLLEKIGTEQSVIDYYEEQEQVQLKSNGKFDLEGAGDHGICRSDGDRYRRYARPGPWGEKLLNYYHVGDERGRRASVDRFLPRVAEEFRDCVLGASPVTTRKTAASSVPAGAFQYDPAKVGPGVGEPEDAGCTYGVTGHDIWLDERMENGQGGGMMPDMNQDYSDIDSSEDGDEDEPSDGEGSGGDSDGGPPKGGSPQKGSSSAKNSDSKDGTDGKRKRSDGSSGSDENLTTPHKKFHEYDQDGNKRKHSDDSDSNDGLTTPHKKQHVYNPDDLKRKHSDGPSSDEDLQTPSKRHHGDNEGGKTTPKAATLSRTGVINTVRHWLRGRPEPAPIDVDNDEVRTPKPSAVKDDAEHDLAVRPKNGEPTGVADKTEGAQDDEPKPIDVDEWLKPLDPNPEEEATEHDYPIDKKKYACWDANSRGHEEAVEGVKDRAAFAADFPRGYRMIETSGSNDWCGLRAVIRSIKEQYPDLPQISFAEMKGLARRFVAAQLKNMDAATVREGLAGQTCNFSADELQCFLQLWSEEHGHAAGYNFHLGFVLRNGKPYLVGIPEVQKAKDMKRLWIYNSNFTGGEERSHYEAIAHCDAGEDAKSWDKSQTAKKVLASAAEINKAWKEKEEKEEKEKKEKKETKEKEKKEESFILTDLADSDEEFDFGGSDSDDVASKPDSEKLRNASRGGARTPTPPRSLGDRTDSLSSSEESHASEAGESEGSKAGDLEQPPDSVDGAAHPNYFGIFLTNILICISCGIVVYALLNPATLFSPDTSDNQQMISLAISLPAVWVFIESLVTCVWLMILFAIKPPMGVLRFGGRIVMSFVGRFRAMTLFEAIIGKSQAVAADLMIKWFVDPGAKDKSANLVMRGLIWVVYLAKFWRNSVAGQLFPTGRRILWSVGLALGFVAVLEGLTYFPESHPAHQFALSLLQRLLANIQHYSAITREWQTAIESGQHPYAQHPAFVLLVVVIASTAALALSALLGHIGAAIVLAVLDPEDEDFESIMGGVESEGMGSPVEENEPVMGEPTYRQAPPNPSDDEPFVPEPWGHPLQPDRQPSSSSSEEIIIESSSSSDSDRPSPPPSATRIPTWAPSEAAVTTQELERPVAPRQVPNDLQRLLDGDGAPPSEEDAVGSSGRPSTPRHVSDSLRRLLDGNESPSSPENAVASGEEIIIESSSSSGSDRPSPPPSTTEIPHQQSSEESAEELASDNIHRPSTPRQVPNNLQSLLDGNESSSSSDDEPVVPPSPQFHPPLPDRSSDEGIIIESSSSSDSEPSPPPPSAARIPILDSPEAAVTLQGPGRPGTPRQVPGNLQRLESGNAPSPSPSPEAAVPTSSPELPRTPIDTRTTLQRWAAGELPPTPPSPPEPRWTRFLPSPDHGLFANPDPFAETGRRHSYTPSPQISPRSSTVGRRMSEGGVLPRTYTAYRRPEARRTYTAYSRSQQQAEQAPAVPPTYTAWRGPEPQGEQSPPLFRAYSPVNSPPRHINTELEFMPNSWGGADSDEVESPISPAESLESTSEYGGGRVNRGPRPNPGGDGEMFLDGASSVQGEYEEAPSPVSQPSFAPRLELSLNAPGEDDGWGANMFQSVMEPGVVEEPGSPPRATENSPTLSPTTAAALRRLVADTDYPNQALDFDFPLGPILTVLRPRPTADDERWDPVAAGAVTPRTDAAYASGPTIPEREHFVRNYARRGQVFEEEEGECASPSSDGSSSAFDSNPNSEAEAAFDLPAPPARRALRVANANTTTPAPAANLASRPGWTSTQLDWLAGGPQARHLALLRDRSARLARGEYVFDLNRPPASPQRDSWRRRHPPLYPRREAPSYYDHEYWGASDWHIRRGIWEAEMRDEVDGLYEVGEEELVRTAFSEEDFPRSEEQGPVVTPPEERRVGESREARAERREREGRRRMSDVGEVSPGSWGSSGMGDEDEERELEAERMLERMRAQGRAENEGEAESPMPSPIGWPVGSPEGPGDEKPPNLSSSQENNIRDIEQRERKVAPLPYDWNPVEVDGESSVGGSPIPMVRPAGPRGLGDEGSVDGESEEDCEGRGSARLWID
jgi:hypothetical protein